MKTKNKKKQIPLLLIALLLISLGAYGTRAYYTENAIQKAGLKLTTGTFKLNLSKGTWVSNNEDHRNKVGGSKTDKDGGVQEFENAIAGEVFTNTFKFANTGSLPQKITFNLEGLANIIPEAEKNSFDIRYTLLPNNTQPIEEEQAWSFTQNELDTFSKTSTTKEFYLAANDFYTFKVEIKVKGPTEKNENILNDKRFNEKHSLDLSEAFVKVTVKLAE